MMLAQWLVGAASAVVATPGTYNIGTASSTADQTFSVVAQIGATDGYLSFSPNGEMMFVSRVTTGVTYKYTLSTAWDITTATYAANTGTLTGGKGFWFRADGLMVYSTNNTAYIYQQSLSTAWNLAGLAAVGSVSIGVQIRGVGINPEGTRGVFYEDNGTNRLIEFTIATPYTISTAVVTGTTRNVTGNEGFACSTDGKHIYTGNASVEQENLATGWDLSTASDGSTDPLDAGSNRGMFIGDTGNSFYVCTNTGIVQRYYLT